MLKKRIVDASTLCSILVIEIIKFVFTISIGFVWKIFKNIFKKNKAEV